jgi:hypothetical protein
MVGAASCASDRTQQPTDHKLPVEDISLNTLIVWNILAPRAGVKLYMFPRRKPGFLLR